MDRNHKPVVLLVDDELILHEMLAHMIASHFTLWSAYNVDAALALLENQRPDIICTDLMMPRRSGLELIEVLKSDPNLASIPIVVISATGYEALIRQAQDLGAHTALPKPFGRVDLLNTLKTVLDLDSDDF